MISIGKHALFILCALLFASCGEEAPLDRGAVVLARVFNRSLFVRDLEGMFPAGTTPYDSILIANAYTQRWIREAVLLHEAEKNLPKDLHIDRMVRDYRSSLVRSHYEQVLLEQLMKTEISREDLLIFYEKNKIQYQLAAPILKGHLLVVPRILSVRDSLNWLWDRPSAKNTGRLQELAMDYGLTCFLDESKWMAWEDIALYLPRSMRPNDLPRKGSGVVLPDGEFEVWLRLTESRKTGELPPLDYVEGQLRRMLMLSRKNQLLEDIKEDMLEIATRKGRVEIFYLN